MTRPTVAASRQPPASPRTQMYDALLLAVLPTAQRKPFLAALQTIVRNLEAAR